MSEPEGKLALDDRAYKLDELVAAKAQLTAADLVAALGDGRAVVRGNAALGLAAIGGFTGVALVPHLRDGDVRVARAAAEALLALGDAQRGNLVAIAIALDGARREVREIVERFFAQLVGRADAEIVDVLETPSSVAATAVIGACGQVGMRGLQLLQKAVRDPRVRVRINAVRGVALLGDLEQASSMDVLTSVERDDDVSDVRGAARAALGTLAVRCQAIAAALARDAEPPRPTVPELETKALSPAELEAAAKIAPLAELVRALESPRVVARQNAVRVLALQGAPDAARPLAARLARDTDDTVRLEAAKALARTGPLAAAPVAPVLVRALGDASAAVIGAAEGTLAELGGVAQRALVDGLETADEAHGRRVATLVGRLADGPRLLRDALSAPALDVRIHAAAGLGALGRARAGGGEAIGALVAAPTGGNARVKAAIAAALAVLDPRPVVAPPKIDLAGFDTHALDDAALTSGKAALAAAGATGLAAHLGDARAVVRANAALALGVLGTDTETVARALAATLRDDAPEVRLAAARALDRAGDAAVVLAVDDLVRALRTADTALSAQLHAMLRARTGAAGAATERNAAERCAAVIDEALVRALADDTHGRRILALACERPSAVAMFSAGFARAETQAMAARGFVMLGAGKLGAGREVLEAARAGTAPAARDLAKAALLDIDGPPPVPALPAMADFETRVLDLGKDKAAFANARLEVGALLPFLRDGRAIVRANTATALGSLGAAAAAQGPTIAALLKDDSNDVRIAAAVALDHLGDDVVIAQAGALVGALASDARVADTVRAILLARGAKVAGALAAGLEAATRAHGLRVADLVCTLPDARELLYAAWDGPAQNVQINAALGLGILGAERAGPGGRARLIAGLTGPFTPRRAAVVEAMALLDRPDRPKK